jgi:hypothetical protein
VTAPSYSGLVRCPLTAVTPVRIRLGSRLPGCQLFTGVRAFFFDRCKRHKLSIGNILATLEIAACREFSAMYEARSESDD